MKRWIYPLLACFTAVVLVSGCKSTAANIDLSPRDKFGNKIVRDLPKLPDNMPPGMAKVQGKAISSSKEGSTVRCVLEITLVEAISETAPPLKTGKIIEVEFPKIVWLRFNEENREQPAIEEVLRVSITYAGKAKSEVASTAWRLKRFFK